jgi:DNA-directed RNA polymerase specialized sigma24 family protein
MPSILSVPAMSVTRDEGNDTLCGCRNLAIHWSVTVSNGESVTQWLDGIKAREGADIQRLWDRYFHRLVRLAAAKLSGHCRRAFDEEDVAISAFQSFCNRAGEGKFPQLAGRDDLWRLLATLTVRKAALMVRDQTRQKRGGGRVVGESGFRARDPGAATGGGLAEILSKEPTPDDSVQFADAFDNLMSKLVNSTLKTIAIRRLEGYTVQEISIELDTSTRTIDRKLKLIRAIWEETAE